MGVDFQLTADFPDEVTITDLPLAPGGRISLRTKKQLTP